MRFALSPEQDGFAGMLDDLLSCADPTGAARSWAAGDSGPGLAIWRRLADLGVTGLLVPEEHGGSAGDQVDLVVACEAIGHHAVPGPWVESVACLPVLLSGLSGSVADLLRSGLADGSVVATVSAPPGTPYALDADVCTHALLLENGTVRQATPDRLLRSVDPARRLFRVEAGEQIGRVEAPKAAAALDTATLASSAQLLGAGERLLGEAVGYAKQRRQFGRAIGEYQALKHALADVRVALDFARPLVYVAALGLRAGSSDASRDVSAAKVAAGDAAYSAARTALQVHGAIGYTAEHDLGLWLTKVRALVGAWGTPAVHRARVLAALTGPDVEEV